MNPEDIFNDESSISAWENATDASSVTIPVKLNTHLYFDENGDVISNISIGLNTALPLSESESDSEEEEVLGCDVCHQEYPEDTVIYCPSCCDNVCETCAETMVDTGGIQCSNDEDYRCPECYGADWKIVAPTIEKQFVMRHPRVVLAFLNFLELYNEVAKGDEVLMIPAMPRAVLNKIMAHPAVENPSTDFDGDVSYLLQLLKKHTDSSS